MAAADAVINLAGAPVAQRWTARHKQRIRDSRVETTQRLVKSMRRAAAPRVLVSASAIGYYGAHGDETLSETDPPGAGWLAGVCQEWEAAAWQARSLDVRVILLRIGIVLGKGGGALAKMLPPFRLGLGGPLGDGCQWMSWIHQEDVIGLMEWSLGNTAVSGPVNATALEPVTMRQFARALGRTLHRPAVAQVPGPVLQLLLGEMAQVLLTGQRVIPQAALAAGYRFRFPELAGALAACMRPTES
jgi:uncharacterized protein (TIGR01777 family)